MSELEKLVKNYYYDDLMYSNVGSTSNTGKVVFSIVGTDSAGVSKVLLRGVVRDQLNLAIAHLYSQIGAGFGNMIEALQANTAQAIDNLPGMRSEYTALFEAILRWWNGGNSGNFSTNGTPGIRDYTMADYRKAYNGTQISIPLHLSTRIYSKASGGTVKTVKEQIQEISDSFVNVKKGVTGNDKLIRHIPPHNLKLEADSTLSKGTLSLYFGEYCKIDNLLLTNWTTTFSREVASYCDQLGTSKISPVYADITVSLEPLTTLTDSDIKQILKVTGGS